MDTVFLACFIFGALFTIASVLLGAAAHGAAQAIHAPHVSAHADHGLHHTAPHAHLDGTHHESAPVPWLNASSAIGGLTWFGAAGYLLLRLGNLAVPAVTLAALVAGALGWYLVARFLGLLLSGEREMDPDDYRLEGTVGKLTVSIPSGGTGEVVFSKAGGSRSEAARAVGNVPIARGTEVVITSYANGFATVQPWTDFLAARDHAVDQRKED